MILTSCNLFVENTPDHTFQIGKIIESSRKLIEKKEFDRGIHFLDSSLNKITNLSINDKLRIYDFKQRYYFWAGRDTVITKHLNKSLIYSDSIINLIKDNEKEEKYKSDLGRAFFNKGDFF